MDLLELLKPILSETIKEIFSFLHAHGISNPGYHDELKIKLSQHLTEAMNWAREVQFYGMNHGEYTQIQTVPLTIDTIPRKFRGIKNKSKKINEIDLLSSHAHNLILGDPGSGKTTTIKRLINMILFEKPTSIKDIWQYPIVILLRIINSKLTIYQIISDTLGIKYEEKIVI